MIILVCSTVALLTGFILDVLFGDPYDFPHIVRWMGSFIARLEKVLRRNLKNTAKSEQIGGAFLVLMVILVCAGLVFGILWLGYHTSLVVGYILESLLCYQLLAAKSLKVESMKVYDCLCNDDIELARKHVSMIVGRDTKGLDQNGIIRAAVETVAENTSDGVTAPLFYMAIGGAFFGCLYKTVNTMDSMLGYKNDTYLYFGRFAAKTDDFFNFLPSRLSAFLMIISAYVLKLDGKNAYYIWKRDRKKHPSPNSAQTESVCAGALRIRLAGSLVYHGIVYDKPFIGDEIRSIRKEDIVAANQLMYTTSILALIICIVFRAVCLGVMTFGAF